MNTNSLSGCNLLGLSSTLAITLSQNLSTEEIGILGAFFTSLGDNLALLAITKASDNQDNCQSNNFS